MAKSDTAAKGSKKTLVMIVAGVFVVAVAAWFLVLKPKDEGAAPTPTTKVSAAKPKTTGATATTVAGAAGTKPAASLPGGQVQETFQIYEVKNPFLPLVNPNAGGGGATDAAGAPAPAPADGSVPPADGSAAPAPAPGTEVPSQGPGTGSAAGGAAAPQPQSTVVAMQDPPFTKDGRLITNVSVNTHVYAVGAGDTFADSFKVVSLDNSCGQFLFGDSQFGLCAGQQILK